VVDLNGFFLAVENANVWMIAADHLPARQAATTGPGIFPAIQALSKKTGHGGLANAGRPSQQQSLGHVFRRLLPIQQIKRPFVSHHARL
jgi:hypothetical protein